MLDAIVAERIELIKEAIRLVESRISKINSASDFIKDEDNLLIMDAISMRPQTISENTKKIHKISPSFFDNLEIDIEPIIRFRDFISHHYEKTDYEIVYDI